MKWLIAKLALSAFFLALIAIAAAKADPVCEGISGYVPYTAYGSPKTIISFQLSPGKWDCSAALETKSNGATVQAAMVSLSQTINKMDEFPRTATSGQSGGPGFGMSVQTIPVRIETAESPTFNVNAQLYFTGGTVQVRASYHCVSPTLSN